MTEAKAGIPSGEGLLHEVKIGLVKPVDVISLRLNNTHAFELASALRTPQDYTPQNLRRNPYVLPPNVSRELYLPVPCVANLQETAEQGGINNLRLIIARHNLVLPSGEIYPAPIDTSVSYTFVDAEGNITRVAGSPVVSILHRLVASSLTNEERMQVIQYHFGQYVRYLPEHNVTVLGIPPKGDDSPTHQALVSFAVPHPQTGMNVERRRNAEGVHTSNVYFFAHGEGVIREQNIEKAQRLMVDAGFKKIADAVGQTWNKNFRSDAVQNVPESPEEKALAKKQIDDINTILIETWRIQQANPF